MTESLGRCLQRLVDCEQQQLLFFCNKAVEASTKDNEIGKKESNLIEKEIKSLENTVKKVAKTVKDPLKGILIEKLKDLKNRQKSSNYEVPEPSNQILLATVTLNELYKQFQIAIVQPDADLKRIDELADRSLEIISTELTTTQLHRAFILIHSIESHQCHSINKMLLDMDILIFKMQHLSSQKTQILQSIRKILYDKLPSCKMGYCIQQNIFEQLRCAAGRSQEDENWGEHHAFDDLKRLSNIIRTFLSPDQTAQLQNDSSIKDVKQPANDPSKDLSLNSRQTSIQFIIN